MLDVRPSLLALAGAVSLVGPAFAGIVPWDQSGRGSGGLNVSDLVSAADFTLTAPARISRVTIWIADGASNDNGVLDDFSGELSWAIFEDDGLDPANPGDLVARGAARELQLIDTGVQSNTNSDLFAIAFELDHPVSLASGDWWLAIREGAWGDASDGSTVWWQTANAVVGVAARWSGELDEQTTWNDHGIDPVFVLLADGIAWDQSTLEPEPGNWWFISAHLPAIDFELPAGGSFSSLEAWLVEDVSTDDGTLNTFSGELSWGIFTNATNKPGLEIDGGDAVGLVQVEAPFQAAPDNDVVRVRILLGRTVTLAPGTYWIGLHEGNWHTGSDGTIVGWHAAAAKVLNGIWTDANPAAPGAWASNDANDDLALVVGETTIFGSGFEAGGACGWSSGLGHPCP